MHFLRLLTDRPSRPIQHHPSSAGRSNDLQQRDRSQQFTVATDHRGQFDAEGLAILFCFFICSSPNIPVPRTFLLSPSPFYSFFLFSLSFLMDFTWTSNFPNGG